MGDHFPHNMVLDTSIDSMTLGQIESYATLEGIIPI